MLKSDEITGVYWIYMCHSINKENLFGKKIFYSKNQFNPWKFLEDIQNGGKSECSKLEQRSVIKVLLAEKCKPCEIYKK